MDKEITDKESLAETELDIVMTVLNEKYNQYDVHGTIFILPKRYEIIEALGSGAYGTVVSARDTKKGREREVAIK